MKRNSSYTLVKLENDYYLLPFGQMIADQRHGCKVNESGVYIWNLLKDELHFEDILEHLSEYYDMNCKEKEEERPRLKTFLENLADEGIICLTPYDYFLSKFDGYFYNIAGLLLKLVCPREAIPCEMNDFLFNGNLRRPDLTISVHTGEPAVSMNGNTLLRNRELVVMDAADTYVLLFPDSPKIIEAHLKKDGSMTYFYCRPDFDDDFRYQFFHAIRLAFLILAKTKNMVVLHSASILYKGKAWLFSAPSGTGKSTHTDLWNSYFGTPIINGDLNLIDVSAASPKVHGIPWCGTSNMCDTLTYPLGGIILLKRDSTDYVEELTDADKELLVSERLITPSWTEEMLNLNLKLTMKITDKVTVCRLHCTQEPSAAITMKEYLDRI